MHRLDELKRVVAEQSRELDHLLGELRQAAADRHDLTVCIPDEWLERIEAAHAASALPLPNPALRA